MKRPCLTVCLFYIIGIIVGYYFSLFYFFVIILLLSLLYLCTIRNQKLFLVFTIIFVIGYLIMYIQEIKYNSNYSTAYYNGQKEIVQGIVEEKLEFLNGNKIYLRPYSIGKNRVKYGLIQLDKRYLSEKIYNGDIIKIKLDLREPEKQQNPGGFSQYLYLKKKGIYSIGYVKSDIKKKDHLDNIFIDNLIMIKKRFIKELNKTMDEPYNQIAVSLLLGERDEVPDCWYKNFTNSGINHLLAISGLHVGFIVLVLMKILNYLHLPAAIKNIIITFFIIIYIFITGFRPSVFRAGLLAAAVIWAPYFSRNTDILNILGFTAILNLFINPYQLFMVGFQLTY
ncbi:MAG: ComEC/Rec2 family competence protein, partial [Halanaerobiales bacterium]